MDMSSHFMPHGGCYLWTKSLITLHTVSDGLIVLSYYSIPLTLFYFVRKRRDLKFNWMFLCFAVFIFACGTTHLMEIWNIWHADYWLSGGIKAVTALASITTAVLLVRLIPAALALPSPDALQKAYDTLEKRVLERTVELMDTTTQLQRENTERKQAEVKLKSSLKEISDLQTALNEHAILEITDHTGCITYVNDKFCSISQYSREELIGQNNRLLNSGFHSPEFFRDLWNVILQGKVWHGEIRNRARDGSCYWVEVTIVPFLDETGKPRQFVGLHTDITERRTAAEKILLLNADLERRVAERTAELESFSYTVSHDLQTPVRAITGFAELIRQEHGQTLTSEASDFIQRIWKNAIKMNALIDGLLSFSRLDQQPLNKKLLSPAAIARQVVEELKLAEPHRQIEIAIAPLPDCQADPILLQQVFVNLLSNAFKYTKFRNLARIEVGVRAQDNQTVYFVADNGAGFDLDKARKLFGVFQRFHKPDEFEGNGAGLAIVHRIIQRHGGQIWAEAKPGQGATFYFTLP